MVPVYDRLVRIHRDGRAPFHLAETFNLDELVVPAADTRSFRGFMERRLFSRVDLAPERIHFLRGDAADAMKECSRYEAELAAGPRFAPDLALVGIGPNGHVAYLEPGSSLAPRTSRVRLSAATRRGLERDGVSPAPTTALTMGIESILAAREILLVATGAAKAEAVAAALEGPVTARCPASFLTVHPALTVVLDRASASMLSSRPQRPSSRGGTTTRAWGASEAASRVTRRPTSAPKPSRARTTTLPPNPPPVRRAP
jgi:glucosamine-6-phosphate deaminase